MSIKYLHIFLWFILCISCCNTKWYSRHITKWTPRNKRMWRGFQSKSNHNSWQVRIVSADGAFNCGGAYIAPLLVVTSAVCINPFRYVLEQVSVESMVYTSDEYDQHVSIDTVYTPQDMRHGIKADVALVRLKTPIKGRLTEFIRLCETNLHDDMKLTVIGYGRSNSETHPTDIKSNSTLRVQGKKKCRNKFGKLQKVPESSFCVLHSDKREKCRYDGGAPLVWKNELCGLVSWGPWCSYSSYPDIYTDINYVKKFVYETEAAIAAGVLA